MTAKQTGLRGKVRDGTVVSDKMQKTVVVAIEANFRHRLYKKTVRRVRRLLAHDERGEAHLGDRVRIAETSPVSRRKRWRLLEVLVKAELPEVAPESIDLALLGEVKAEEPEGMAAASAATTTEGLAEPAPAEGVSSAETEAVVPEEVEVAEEVPEIEAAVGADSDEAEPEGAGEGPEPSADVAEEPAEAEALAGPETAEAEAGPETLAQDEPVEAEAELEPPVDVEPSEAEAESEEAEPAPEAEAAVEEEPEAEEPVAEEGQTDESPDGEETADEEKAT